MSDIILNLKHVTKTYVRKKDGQKQEVQAAKDVSFQVERHHVVALVGESGSGKSTLAKLITGVEKADSGEIDFDGQSIKIWGRKGLRQYRRHVQMVFQDPFAALNPLNTVEYTVKRPLVNYEKVSGDSLKERTKALLETVQLTPVHEFLFKYPFELSGGQLQRVVIARAIASNPSLIVADEPVSMLDVSIRADILRLMDNLREHHGVSFLYITHDLVSARMLADEIVVLYRGRVVEQGPANDVVKKPVHPYTQLLLQSVPNPWAADSELKLSPPAANTAQRSAGGCVFRDRCPYAMKICETEEPALTEIENGRKAACYLHSPASSVDERPKLQS